MRHMTNLNPHTTISIIRQKIMSSLNNEDKKNIEQNVSDYSETCLYGPFVG